MWPADQTPSVSPKNVLEKTNLGALSQAWWARDFRTRPGHLNFNKPLDYSDVCSNVRTIGVDHKWDSLPNKMKSNESPWEKACFLWTLSFTSISEYSKWTGKLLWKHFLLPCLTVIHYYLEIIKCEVPPKNNTLTGEASETSHTHCIACGHMQMRVMHVF